MKKQTHLPTPEYDPEELSPEEFSHLIKRKTIAHIGAGIACSVLSYALFTIVATLTPNAQTPVTAQQTDKPSEQITPKTKQTSNPTVQTVPTTPVDDAKDASEREHQPPTSTTNQAKPESPKSNENMATNHSRQKTETPAKREQRDPLDIDQNSSNKTVAKATPPVLEKSPTPSSDIHKEPPMKASPKQTEEPAPKPPKEPAPCSPPDKNLSELWRHLIE